MLARVALRQIVEFLVILLRLSHIAQLERESSELVEQTLADRSLLICQKQYLLRLVVVPVVLIDRCHHRQEADIVHAPPVYAVAYLLCCLVISRLDLLFELLRLDVELVLIHLRPRCTLTSAYARRDADSLHLWYRRTAACCLPVYPCYYV